MPDSVDEQCAELTSPKAGGWGGRTYPVRGTLRGRDGEWFRVESRGHRNIRVVRVGIDGLSEATSYRVRAEDFVEATSNQQLPDVSVVGQRGAVVISARLRNRLGILEGTVVVQEEHEGGVWIRPAQVIPHTPEPVPQELGKHTLASLLAGITTENRHDEIDFGPAVGAEQL